MNTTVTRVRTSPTRTVLASLGPVNRRIATLLLAMVPVIGLGIAGTMVTVPFVALGPGPTFNTLGEVDGKQVVDIKGIATDPTSGNLNMTTVSVRDGLSLFEAFGYWIGGDEGIVPRAEVYPPDKSRQEIDKSNAADFTDSEQSAQVAALRYLKYPISVEVGSVGADGPAKAALHVGDELISVNGTAVDSTKAVQAVVAKAKPNSAAVVVFRRNGSEQSADVKLGARPGDTGKGYLGIGPKEVPRVPFTIDFNLADIGGPSAGLMFSLAVIDKLTKEQLSGGGFVAGTGTIDDDGKVGPIGGIEYKMKAARDAGASTFLVPADNCNEARQRTPSGLRLVKVDTLSSAVRSLEALNSGATAPTCG